MQNQELFHRLGEFPLDGAQTHAQLTRAAEQTRKALEREREKTASVGRDVAEARGELKANSVQHRREPAEERERAATLSRELARARDEIEAHAALSSKTGAEAAQVKQAAESATAELRQSLQQERDRAEAMAREIGSARRIQARIAFERAANSLAPIPARRRYSDR